MVTLHITTTAQKQSDVLRGQDGEMLKNTKTLLKQNREEWRTEEQSQFYKQIIALYTTEYRETHTYSNSHHMNTGTSVTSAKQRNAASTDICLQEQVT